LIILLKRTAPEKTFKDPATHHSGDNSGYFQILQTANWRGFNRGPRAAIGTYPVLIGSDPQCAAAGRAPRLCEFAMMSCGQCEPLAGPVQLLTVKARQREAATA
jgi:hypothetical protein